MAPSGSGTVRRCGSVGACVLVGSVVTVDVSFVVSHMLKPHPLPHLTSSCLKDVELSAPSSAPCLPACHNVTQ